MNLYATQARIDATTQNSLIAKLNEAQSALERGNTNVARNKLAAVIDECRKRVAADVANVLIADALYVLGTL